jgi:RecB family exonuclease
MGRIIAYCGLPCSECPAYRATQAEDGEMLDRVLEQWREAFEIPQLAVADIVCDGCLPSEGRLCGYCRHCKIRPCAMARNIANCAYCDEYACDELERLLAICDQQEGFFGYARRARSTLEAIRTEQMG